MKKFLKTPAKKLQKCTAEHVLVTSAWEHLKKLKYIM